MTDVGCHSALDSCCTVVAIYINTKPFPVVLLQSGVLTNMDRDVGEGSRERCFIIVGDVYPHFHPQALTSTPTQKKLSSLVSSFFTVVDMNLKKFYSLS